MITETLFGVFCGLIGGVLALLPSWTPPDWTAMGGSWGGALVGVNNIVPVYTLGVCLGVVMAVRLFIFAWGAVVFIYQLIPFKFT